MNRNSIKFLLNSTTFSSNPPPSFQFLTNLGSKLPYSSSSSSSLEIISNSNPKSLSNPFYNLLPKTQNPNNIVTIIYSSLKQDNTQLSHLQSHSQIKHLLLPHHLGTNEISRVLLRCQSDSIAALTFFNWVENDLSLKPSIHNYCFLLHILASSKEFKKAMVFLLELVRNFESVDDDVFQCLVLCCDDCNWDPVIFDMLIKTYVKEGMIEKGFISFSKMIEIGCVPSVVATNCLLNGLLKLNCIDQCWQVYAEMGRVGINPNTFTFNILTRVFCQYGDNISKANLFLEKMEEDEGFEPDIVTYNTLISCYCRKQRLSDAFYLYRIMYRRNVFPDLVTYTTLMNGLCKEGRLREAHQIFHRMIHRGLNPDIVTFNTLICAYCNEGKMREARSLLYQMIGSKICPDNFTCRVLVQGHGKEGRMVSALNLVVELERYGVSISWDIYDYLIVSVCEEDHPFAAKSLLERISHRGYTPSVEIYCKIIECLCKNDSVADALLLKTEMVVERNLNPNLTTYKALMCCLCRMGKISEAECLMEEMVECGMLSDPEICRGLVCMYCKENDVVKAEALLEFFGRKFQIFDTESYNKLVKTFSELGDDANKLIELQDRMLKVGFAPNHLSFKQMIHGLWKSMEKDKDKDKLILLQ